MTTQTSVVRLFKTQFESTSTNLIVMKKNHVVATLIIQTWMASSYTYSVLQNFNHEVQLCAFLFAGKSHYLFMGEILYDNIVYYSDEEHQNNSDLAKDF